MNHPLTTAKPVHLICAECLGEGAVPRRGHVDACGFCAFRAEAAWREAQQPAEPPGRAMLRLIAGGRR